MTKRDFVLRPIRNADIARFSKHWLPRQRVGFAAEYQGEFAGIGVVCWAADGSLWAFFDAEIEWRGFAGAVHRSALVLLDSVQKVTGLDVNTICDTDKRLAGKWLAMLGFAESGEFMDGVPVYVRRAFNAAVQ